ncbi:site-2 protease family protein [Synechococcus sp. PCC 6312]|uniref:site-2 protease family protein n=1 Tax=Synechococcus sp. (strain ATCC 27167 / PCC 6312) TaxID=195253 RepID=UPI00029F2E79|nr:site-2 protease family protein [Synechococcus sp. PCC 6312]AFY61492.1 putative membrane-associated Zn-dependent protease [Synechococcus sp. PCC 6312]
MVFTGLTIIGALLILGWGLYRALPMGKLGIVAWLQSVVLMLPWLLLFGLMSVGVNISFAAILGFLLISVGVYIGLGRWLRALAAASPLSPSISSASDQPLDQPNSGGITKAGEVSLEAEPIATIPGEDFKAVQGIFGIDTFFATELKPYKEGLICRGNLRGETKTVHQTLTTRLETVLPDKYRLFMVPNQENKPVVIILPRREPEPPAVSEKILATVLGIAAVATSLEASSLVQGFSFYQEPGRISQSLPLALGLILILIAHELGHRWMANQYNQVLPQRDQIRLSWPFFIPAWQLGSFGAILRFDSFLPNRTVLFDLAIAGPAVGGVLSLAVLVVGLLLSHPGSVFQIPSLFFQGSILVGTLAKAILGEALQAELVDVSPFVIIGWLGLVVTALNLMPAGQLDGGRIIQAIYGPKVATRSTWITLIVLGLVALGNPLALYWALLIIFLQRDIERPNLEEMTEPDDTRAGLGLLALLLMAATLIPLAPGLAGRLGIG